MPPKMPSKSLLSWCFPRNGGHSEEDYDSFGAALTPPPSECYACTQHDGSLVYHSTQCDHTPRADGAYSPKKPKSSAAAAARRSTLDPESGCVKTWNRATLVGRAASLVVDPLFFFVLTVTGPKRPCLFVDFWLTVAMTLLRTCVDGFYLMHVLMEFRLAYVPRASLVVGGGTLVWDPRAIAAHYLRSLEAFWFDIFVILPVPQVVYWTLVPRTVEEQRTSLTMKILVSLFLLQFIPKLVHLFTLMKRLGKVTGYVFGTICYGIGLNLFIYFILSHAVGGVWYGLSIQRLATCISRRCPTCNLPATCAAPSLYLPEKDLDACFNAGDLVNFGIYSFALPFVAGDHGIAVRILYSYCWGMYQFSSMGNNLTPASESVELVFCIFLVIGGLLLFSLFVGNVQELLTTAMSNKRTMQVRRQDLEWWMRRKRLPSALRDRVRKFENQRWIFTGAFDETQLLQDLPDGLRRDIKRYLCLDFIKKVPPFNCFDDLTLDNICERIRPLIYSKGEKIGREGDPVQKMVFIVQGRVVSSQRLRSGNYATSVLEGGAFLGDQLLSWCLRKPFFPRLPASSATFVCTEATDAFGLDAYDLHYITEHFRRRFVDETMKRTLRYHSSHWRTWAAVNIQLAWRRYLKKRKKHLGNCGEKNWLRFVATAFMSSKPHDHLE